MRASGARPRLALGGLTCAPARLLLLLGLACAPVLPPPPAPPPPPPTAIDDADLIALVPAPVEAVLSIDLACLRKSPWAKPVLAAATPEERAARAAQRGFDEIDDMDTWVLARPPASAGTAVALEIFRGRYDPARVRRQFLARHPDATESAGGGTPLLVAGAEEAVAFLTERTLAIGAPAVVRAAVEVGWRRGRAARDEAWLARVLGSLDDEAGRRTSNVALEVAYLPSTDVRAEVGLALGAGGDAVERLGGRLLLDEAAHLVVVATTSDKHAAAGLAQAAAGGVAALKVRRSVAALGLRSMLDRLRLSARGARVVGELTVSSEERDLVSQNMATLARFLASSPPPAP